MRELLQRGNRRGFLGRVSAALGLALGSAALPEPARAAAASLDSPGDEEWLKKITGKHRQVYDAVSVNQGFPLGFAMNFLDTNIQGTSLTDKDLTAVVVLRHFAIPIALKDEIWAKYKLGEMFELKDPATKEAAARNYFYNPKPGDLMLPGSAYDKMLARGVIFPVCNVALTVISGLRAPVAGVTAEQAKAEWVAGLLPGAFPVPSGVWAVNRAQERGCTYCYAG
ncbi:MAG TPA: twin-arginine translocation signal domain-containing protein [Longimicrobiales bacterium]|nr:twin-arginine translocation signal domain-containing protein [Longimicrobiales bacterium]